MRVGLWVVIAAAAVGLSGCGGGESSGPKLFIVCDGGTSVVGATSLDVSNDLAARGATLRYPDPIATGKTGTISLSQGQHCKVTIDKGS